ncbi:hypothetical protein HIM_04088 [Hirsutella minnesotensis 3608]|uniref:Uncharacterized protein n=1 Tax=Hirsutella minnesotensis 3608 TaxID=1043627 RepID=A0A0F8A629_9HYPO|nr:hypothetical protein HIM_04088 [Hirsutella minnesotensis 3608]
MQASAKKQKLAPNRLVKITKVKDAGIDRLIVTLKLPKKRPAQEVDDFLEELASGSEGPISYHEVAEAGRAAKDLKTVNEKLQQQVDALRAQVASLEAQLKVGDQVKSCEDQLQAIATERQEFQNVLKRLDEWVSKMETLTCDAAAMKTFNERLVEVIQNGINTNESMVEQVTNAVMTLTTLVRMMAPLKLATSRCGVSRDTCTLMAGSLRPLMAASGGGLAFMLMLRRFLPESDCLLVGRLWNRAEPGYAGSNRNAAGYDGVSISYRSVRVMTRGL